MTAPAECEHGLPPGCPLHRPRVASRALHVAVVVALAVLDVATLVAIAVLAWRLVGAAVAVLTGCAR